MSLTRKMLKAMGIEDASVDLIMDAHVETTDSLKAERDKYKEAAEKLPEVQKQLDEQKAKDGDGWKEKHDALKKQFDEYKAGEAAKETAAKKKAAVRDLLKEAGVSEKRLDSVLRVYNMDDVELDEEGKIKDAEERSKAVKTDWSDFIETTVKKGATIVNPPANSGGAKTKEDIMAIKDRSERRAAIAENIDLFQ